MLPILPSRLRILYCLENYRTIIIQGETGSGKTTQIPQYLHEAGWTENGFKVVCTQPRRVAAISIAARVAGEMNVRLGSVVGYAVRFDANESNRTKILYSTDGRLVRETMQDPLLRKYSVVMVDEAHERTVYTDILLGLLRKIRRKRPELRVIIASATLEAKLFKRYMETNRNHKRPEKDTAVIVSVEGRQHAVDLLYLESPAANYLDKVVETVMNIHRRETLDSGDILVFLPGQEGIRYCLERLNTFTAASSLYSVPLYAELSSKDQLVAFQKTPQGKRKCVLATNIAETSVTINGIGYVVDSLFVKLPCYDPTEGMETLVVQPVSKAQAKQRAGRAGRIRPGKCFRIAVEADFSRLPKQTVPEIQRTNLTWTILQVKALGIDDVLHFPFISPPPAESLIRGLEILYSLKAIDDSAALTNPLGSRLVQFPVEPRIGAALLASVEMQCTQEALSVAAMLSINSPFVDLKKASYMMKLLGTQEGDHLLLLNLYNTWVKKRKSRSWCYDNGISASNMARADELRQNLRKYLQKIAKTEGASIESSPDPEVILKCFAKGFFANVARLSTSSQHYLTVKENRKVALHPSSLFANFGIPPKWVMFYEVTRTTEEFIREVSRINPLWLRDIAPHYYHTPGPGASSQDSKKRTVGPEAAGNQLSKKARHKDDLEKYLKGNFQF